MYNRKLHKHEKIARGRVSNVMKLLKTETYEEMDYHVNVELEIVIYILFVNHFATM